MKNNYCKYCGRESPSVSSSTNNQPIFDSNRPSPRIIYSGTRLQRQQEVIDTDKQVGGGSNSTIDLINYRLPILELLDEPNSVDVVLTAPEELLRMQAALIDAFTYFGIAVAPGDITCGPAITLYEIYTAKGVRVDKLERFDKQIATSIHAVRINILATVPGKNTVGIEIANTCKGKILLRELFESEDWHNSKAKIPLALGKDINGAIVIADLTQMPHCLVAGTNGIGKSVCINSMISSILYRFTPEQIQFIHIDTKFVRNQIFNTLPHLLMPVVTDVKKAVLTLRWVIDEIERRYLIFRKSGVRNISTFNARSKPKLQKELDEDTVTNGKLGSAPNEKAKEAGIMDIHKTMPYIVVIVDELVDLMQSEPTEIENSIARITLTARAAGIHMLVATQTPRADIITSVIKENIPSRIAFQVASKIDSRVILDELGADRLFGDGQMLYQPNDMAVISRVQGAFVTDDEIRRLIDYISA